MKKEEEKRVIAEMEAGLKERETITETETQTDEEPVMHCKRCRTVMQKGVCPACGFRVYVPMDEKKVQKIRMIAGGICIVVFLVILLIKEICK